MTLEGCVVTVKGLPPQVRCVPGQTVLAFFRAQNLSDAAITGVSTYNVTPMKAGPYFNKIQCFCFEEQRLQAGEEVDMPVFFYVVRARVIHRQISDIRVLIYYVSACRRGRRWTCPSSSTWCYLFYFIICYIIININTTSIYLLIPDSKPVLINVC